MGLGLGNKSTLGEVRERSWFRLNIDKGKTSCFVLQVTVEFFNI